MIGSDDHPRTQNLVESVKPRWLSAYLTFRLVSLRQSLRLCDIRELTPGDCDPRFQGSQDQEWLAAQIQNKRLVAYHSYCEDTNQSRIYLDLSQRQTVWFRDFVHELVHCCQGTTEKMTLRDEVQAYLIESAVSRLGRVPWATKSKQIVKRWIWKQLKNPVYQHLVGPGQEAWKTFTKLYEQEYTSLMAFALVQTGQTTVVRKRKMPSVY